ncbi:hypothetical protein ANO11243_085670 [Dothideomycetidae sp. 11243]|nr:hypothetical protein ANO11243_085670 [fungal sp. No.11243]
MPEGETGGLAPASRDHATPRPERRWLPVDDLPTSTPPCLDHSVSQLLSTSPSAHFVLSLPPFLTFFVGAAILGFVLLGPSEASAPGWIKPPPNSLKCSWDTFSGHINAARYGAQFGSDEQGSASSQDDRIPQQEHTDAAQDDRIPVLDESKHES